MTNPLILRFLSLFGLCVGYVGSCPHGWEEHGDYCYLFIGHQYTWSAAAATCAALGGRLPEVYSAEQNAFVTNLLRKHGGTSAWLGMEDFAIHNEFVYSSTQELPEYTNWAPGEPNSLQGLGESEDCVELIASSGHWNDERCEHSIHQFSCICQRE